jgi:hypothetical protein
MAILGHRSWLIRVNAQIASRRSLPTNDDEPVYAYALHSLAGGQATMNMALVNFLNMLIQESVGT